jgi:hypothetical protein
MSENNNTTMIQDNDTTMSESKSTAMDETKEHATRLANKEEPAIEVPDGNPSTESI